MFTTLHCRQVRGAVSDPHLGLKMAFQSDIDGFFRSSLEPSLLPVLSSTECPLSRRTAESWPEELVQYLDLPNSQSELRKPLG